MQIFINCILVKKIEGGEPRRVEGGGGEQGERVAEEPQGNSDRVNMDRRKM